VLAKERPEVKVVVCEPADAPMLTSSTAQERESDGSPAARHPAWKPHPIQGWSPDFIPKLTSDAVDMDLVDRVITIPGSQAMHWSRQLAQKEGIFVGISAGATFAAALEVCADAPKGATVLCMLPDTGERYLSTPLFADILAEMNEEELANRPDELSQSGRRAARSKSIWPPAVERQPRQEVLRSDGSDTLT